MIRLLLIRHAKSSWAVRGEADRERRLNDRGRRDAPRLGRWLRESGLCPDHGLVSAAARTRETWALLCEGMGAVPAIFDAALYEAEPEAVLRAIRGAPAAATLAVVGHNPGIGETARRLLRAPPGRFGAADYPTGATAVITFDREQWSEVAPGDGALDRFVTPKTLDAE